MEAADGIEIIEINCPENNGASLRDNVVSSRNFLEESEISLHSGVRS